MRLTLGFALSAFVLGSAQAADWTGAVDLGADATSGNTETVSLTASTALGVELQNWRHSFNAKAINKTDDGDTTAEAYNIGLKSDLKITERDYLYALADGEYERFGGVRERGVLGLGYGRKLINNKDFSLEGEIGGGFRYSRALDDVITREGVGRASLAAIATLSDSATFTQKFVLEGGEENVRSESQSELRLKVIGNIAAKLFANVKHNTSVPMGTKKLDTHTGVSLSYAFGKKD
ncbi:MAG: DUF481 domain-containing protein [Alphaproteobacteria bacterium]